MDDGDDELVGLYLQGDIDAFDALFDRHYGAVYSFARMMLGDAGEAEDVLQETFLAVARSAGSYRGPGRFRTWLLRIVRNRCLNRLDARRARQVLLRAGPLEGVEIIAAGGRPDQQAVTAECQAALEAALIQLPDRQREALVLFAYERLAYRQIAEVLDVPVNTVKTLIHRARAELALRLDGQE